MDQQAFFVSVDHIYETHIYKWHNNDIGYLLEGYTSRKSGVFLQFYEKRRLPDVRTSVKENFKIFPL